MESIQLDDRSVLSKAFRILRTCADSEWQLSIGQLAQSAGLPKSTTHRLVAQLSDCGALERTEGGVVLGSQLFELGACVSHARVLRSSALPYMEDLYEATHQIVHLGVLDEFEILYVDKICGRRRAHVATRVGGRIPAGCTALGKAVLSASQPEVVDRLLEHGLVARTTETVTDPEEFRSQLRDAAKQGVAYERGEGTVGISCVAAAILNSRDEPIAGISITGPAAQFRPERFADSVRLSALAISRQLRRSQREMAQNGHPVTLFAQQPHQAL